MASSSESHGTWDQNIALDAAIARDKAHPMSNPVSVGDDLVEPGLGDMSRPDLYAEVTALRKSLLEAASQLAALREALEFYANPKSYQGPNQRAEEGEKHTVGSYRIDVTRDGGDIARAALNPKAPS